jgi:hypothetical protein
MTTTTSCESTNAVVLPPTKTLVVTPCVTNETNVVVVTALPAVVKITLYECAICHKRHDSKKAALRCLEKCTPRTQVVIVQQPQPPPQQVIVVPQPVYVVEEPILVPSTWYRPTIPWYRPRFYESHSLSHREHHTYERW